MIGETYTTDSGQTFDIEIAPAPADGKKYPVVVLLHGNLGLVDPFGRQLRDFTQEIADLHYLAALPSYYSPGEQNPRDTDIAVHVPALRAAIKHLRGRPDADPDRLGLVGFSLGGGIAMSFINASSAGAVDVFADFFGYVAPLLGAGVAKFPPTIIFHNEDDPVVRVKENSEPLADALAAAHISHQPERPYHWFQGHWEPGFGHAFEPGSPDDLQSRADTRTWLTTHMPPTGKP
jgi:dienelactone hydrolase